MTMRRSPARRQVLQGAGLVAAATLADLWSPRSGEAHEGHDHAPRTILDLKGKLVRIVGPDQAAGEEFIEDRVTILVNAQRRIVALRYG